MIVVEKLTKQFNGQVVLNGIDLHTDYVKTVSSVDGKAIGDFLKNIVLKPGNHLEVIMKATKEEAGK